MESKVWLTGVKALGSGKRQRTRKSEVRERAVAYTTSAVKTAQAPGPASKSHSFSLGSNRPAARPQSCRCSLWNHSGRVLVRPRELVRPRRCFAAAIPNRFPRSEFYTPAAPAYLRKKLSAFHCGRCGVSAIFISSFRTISSYFPAAARSTGWFRSSEGAW